MQPLQLAGTFLALDEHASNVLLNQCPQKRGALQPKSAFEF